MLGKVFVRRAILKKVTSESWDARRRSHVAAVPARNKVPFGTKVAGGIVLSVVPWIYPFWVLIHLEVYQKGD